MKPYYVLLTAFVPLIAAQAETTGYRLTDTNFDFAAPVVPNTTAISDLQVGMIVFDQATNSFKGLNSSGNWDSMSAANGAGNVTSTDSNAIHIESARLTCANGGGSTAVSQTGTWVTGVSSGSGAGSCSITITSGEFSAAPYCQCTAIHSSGNGRVCTIDTTSVTPSATAIAFQRNSAGTPENGDVFITCMGPHN